MNRLYSIGGASHFAGGWNKVFVYDLAAEAWYTSSKIDIPV